MRYTRGSKVLGIEPGEYARVERVEAQENRITIEREKGEHQSYDPRRLAGVAVAATSKSEWTQAARLRSIFGSIHISITVMR